MEFLKKLFQKNARSSTSEPSLETNDVRGPRQEVTIDHREAMREPLREPGNRRVVQTARTEAAINEAAQNGFWPLVKPVVPDLKIRSKIAVFQNKTTGTIVTSSDYRGGPEGSGPVESTMVIKYMFYYPHSFPRPFAAYLLPPDLKVGECVWLEDLIEDIIGDRWNQGDVIRLKAAPAIWDGTDFDILFETKSDAHEWVG